MLRLSPSGQRVGDNCYRGQRPLNKIYSAGGLSLDSLSLGFKKISHVLQFADKFVDLRNRWSANPLNEWALSGSISVLDGSIMRLTQIPRRQRCNKGNDFSWFSAE